MRTRIGHVFLVGSLCLAGCPGDDGEGNDTGSTGDTGSVDTGGSGGTCEPLGGSIDPLDASCEPLATDYTPTVDMSADDMWPACVTDDAQYHLVDATPSSIARVEAYDEILDLLGGEAPTTEDFTNARVVYAQDEGLESRMVRREDLHYPEIPMADWDPGVDPDKQCTVEANIMKYPDRCAGPAKITPLVNDAFAAGQMGEGTPEVHAARIDAAISWFLFLSPYKECFTCTLKAKDCDSCWAYYTGGTNRAGGIGLSARIKALSEDANEAIWDGFSAVRCWRDLYPIEQYPTMEDLPVEGQQLFEQGWEQLDNALWHGFALLVRDRLERQLGACGVEAEANWAWVQVAGPVLDFEAQSRDATQAATLAAVWATDPPTVEDIQAAVTAIDALFPCPQP